MSKEYWQKLQDPRWQKKRLEVFQRDGFKCMLCSSEDKRLEVHHRYYVGGRQPWEYPLTALATVCTECHGISKDTDVYEQDWEAMMGYLDGAQVGTPFRYRLDMAIPYFAKENNIDPGEVTAMLAWLLADKKIDHETVISYRNACKEFEQECIRRSA